MQRQLYCHGMCINMLCILCSILDENKIKALPNLNIGWKIFGTMDPRTVFHEFLQDHNDVPQGFFSGYSNGWYISESKRPSNLPYILNGLPYAIMGKSHWAHWISNDEVSSAWGLQMPLWMFGTRGHFNMGQVTEVWLSCYLVLLSVDSKTR